MKLASWLQNPFFPLDDDYTFDDDFVSMWEDSLLAWYKFLISEISWPSPDIKNNEIILEIKKMLKSISSVSLEDPYPYDSEYQDNLNLMSGILSDCISHAPSFDSQVSDFRLNYFNATNRKALIECFIQTLKLDWDSSCGYPNGIYSIVFKVFEDISISNKK